MKDPQIGWIAAIIIGGVAGWLAEQFMKSEMGVCTENLNPGVMVMKSAEDRV